MGSPLLKSGSGALSGGIRHLRDGGRGYREQSVPPFACTCPNKLMTN